MTIYRRAWWRPKPGPVLTPGRWIHFLLAWALTVTAGVFGQLGPGLGLMILFWLWEALTPIAPWRGRHPWADVVDFLAFEAGQIVGAIVVLIARRA